jgi:organic radical activating enzyme
VVCTGGEPLLQLDEPAIEAMHRVGFEVAVETNGTQPAPSGIDWICVSPKAGAPLVLTEGRLRSSRRREQTRALSQAPPQFFLQPMDGPDRARNTGLALRYCLQHPEWRLSLQTHKMLGIP